MSTETMKLEQLIQATSGLKNRNVTPILAGGKPIAEVRISLRDDVPCVNLMTADSVMERYDARCAIHESNALPRITEEEFVAHLEEDSFFSEYGNPVIIQTREHGELICMSYAYHERLQRELEAARAAVSAAPIPAEQTREVAYWIYEFQMPEEEKKRLLDRAAALGMALDEYVQMIFRNAMEHPDEADKEVRLQRIRQANMQNTCLVRMYPVYQGETEAQALKRAMEEERQRRESDA